MTLDSVNKTISAESIFSKKLKEIDEAVEIKKKLARKIASGKVVIVEKWYQEKLKKIRDDHKFSLDEENRIHAKRMAEAKNVLIQAKKKQQSERAKLSVELESNRSKARIEKKEKLGPIENELNGELLLIDQWKQEQIKEAEAQKAADTSTESH